MTNFVNIKMTKSSFIANTDWIYY